jgi:hypothetical protein
LSNTELDGGRWRVSIPLQPGMSGAPIFDTEGIVVGIAVGGTPEVDMKTVVPSAHARRLLEQAKIAFYPEKSGPTQGARGGKPRLLFVEVEQMKGDDGAVRKAFDELVDRIAQVRILFERSGTTDYALTRLRIGDYGFSGMTLKALFSGPGGELKEVFGKCENCKDSDRKGAILVSDFWIARFLTTAWARMA